MLASGKYITPSRSTKLQPGYVFLPFNTVRNIAGALGIAVLDYVFQVETMPQRPEKYRSQRMATVGTVIADADATDAVSVVAALVRAVK